MSRRLRASERRLERRCASEGLGATCLPPYRKRHKKREKIKKDTRQTDLCTSEGLGAICLPVQSTRLAARHLTAAVTHINVMCECVLTAEHGTSPLWSEDGLLVTAFLLAPDMCAMVSSCHFVA